jgi:hypothetical protein
MDNENRNLDVNNSNSSAFIIEENEMILKNKIDVQNGNKNADIENNNILNENLTSTAAEKNSFAMPDKIRIDKVIFSTHFIAFCKQSVKGSIMAIYRFYSDEGKFSKKSREEVRDVLRDGNFVFQNNIQYLNSCWKSFFNKSDQYIIDKFSMMLKYGNYLHEHESCLFTHIWDFSQMLLFYVLARLDISELRDVDFLNQCIEIIMDAILSHHVDDIMQRDNFCNDKCEVFKYKKGEDFIQMKLIKK